MTWTCPHHVCLSAGARSQERVHCARCCVIMPCAESTHHSLLTWTLGTLASGSCRVSQLVYQPCLLSMRWMRSHLDVWLIFLATSIGVTIRDCTSGLFRILAR